MSSLSAATCDLHRERAAAARCPGCRRFYCEECITEHDGRLRCAACLAKERKQPDDAAAVGRAEAAGVGSLGVGVWLLQGLVGLLVCWAIYYALARVLMAIPADFHDGTLWES